MISTSKRESTALQHKSSETIEKELSRKIVATSIKAILRSRKAGKCGIYIRVSIAGKTDYYPTGYYVDEKNFDGKAGMVRVNDPDKDNINSYIRYHCQELDEVLRELKKSDQVISRENFRRHFQRRKNKDLPFRDFF